MKFILCILVCLSSLLFSAASSSESDRSEKKVRVADRAIRLRSVSAMGSKQSLSKGNPHHLKLVASCDESAQHRRRSKSGSSVGAPLSRSSDVVDTKPVESPRERCLQRVASFNSVKKKLEREKEKEVFESRLLPHEKRVYAILGYDDFMFAKDAPGLLKVLMQMLNDKRTPFQVHQAYTGYLRCRVETLSKKILDHGIEASDEPSCSIKAIIDQAVSRKKLSPRLSDVPGDVDDARVQVAERLDEAKKAFFGVGMIETAVLVEADLSDVKKE